MEKKYLYVLLILSMLTVSCKTYQKVTEQNSSNVERSDNYERDSIVIRDSVIVRIAGDTVYKDRWHTEYKDRVVQQVDTVVRVDERIVEQVIEKKVIPRWAWWVTGYCLLVTGLIILWIILKIKRII